ncbi:homeobox protein Hox-B4-like [Anticarsia gemmatalis]|uniref:homeobox protein Hox-B4-like n=1 Tax=Anticarsia gemmatalis TaxID=129554 RepID=UPI003F771D44
MYPCQGNTDFYFGEPSMTSSTESYWPYDQNQPENYQACSNIGVVKNDYIQNASASWSPEYTNVQETGHLQHILSSGTDQFHCSSFHQHPSVQYTPLTPEPVAHTVFDIPRPQQNGNVMAKRHRAQISFVPTKSGNFKAIVKRKRKRTVFTTEQVEALEHIFKRKQYITREDRQVIVNQLQLNDKAVKIWFQNRRLKDKKGPEQVDEEYENIPSEEQRAPDVARLDYVESQINQKADEFGYVTLDDSLMKDLYNVIDDFLSNSKTVPSERTVESDSSPVYEPISPASVSDSNDEENACWKPSEPNESLQRLFDLQTMLSL